MTEHLVSQQVAKKSRRIKTITWHKMKTVRIRSLVLQESFYPTADVSYAAVKTRMVTLLGIVDCKSVLAYLGRPKYEQKSMMNQTVTYLKSGTVVPKKHSFRRKIAAKRGYIDVFGLGYVYADKNDWWIHWNHKGLVNEVFLRDSQTRDDCVGVSPGDVDDEKVTMQNISPPNMEEDVALHDSIVKDREERDTLGEREICQKRISQAKCEKQITKSCIKSVKSMEKDTSQDAYRCDTCNRNTELGEQEQVYIVDWDIRRERRRMFYYYLTKLKGLQGSMSTASVMVVDSLEVARAVFELAKKYGRAHLYEAKELA